MGRLAVTGFARPASVQWVATENTEAYATVLRIRREAYVRAGKLPVSTTDDQLRGATTRPVESPSCMRVTLLLRR